jgi:hypothetical protein
MYDIDLSDLEKQLKTLERYDEIAARHLTGAMQQSVIILEGSAREFAPVYQGRLRQSIGSEVVRDAAPGSIVGRVGSSLRGEVYPLVMELGRPPGKMPLVEALRRWAHLVLGDEGLAFVVARAIGRRGIKGRFFLKQAFEKNQARIGQFFTDALAALAKELAV